MSTLYVPETGFCGVKRWQAAGILLVLACFISLGLFLGVATPQYNSPQKAGVGDGVLYARIIDDVARGENYHVAAVREQRMWGYTLKPVWTVREPALAVGLAASPAVLRPLLLQILALAVLFVWCWRVHKMFQRPVITAWTFVMLFMALFYVCADKSWLFHESWAGLLIALSIGVRSKEKWWLAVICGLLAVLIRELALPYLLVMALAAWREGNRREAGAWIAAILLWGAAIAWHAMAVSALVLPSDPASRGWLAAGGWPYVLLLARWNGMLIASAPVVVATVLPLMLLGACAWPGVGGRLALITLGYAAGFLFFGRPDTSYWGLVMTPLWGIGAIMAPGAVRDLVNALAVRKKTDT